MIGQVVAYLLQILIHNLVLILLDFKCVLINHVYREVRFKVEVRRIDSSSAGGQCSETDIQITA